MYKLIKVYTKKMPFYYTISQNIHRKAAGLCHRSLNRHVLSPSSENNSRISRKQLGKLPPTLLTCECKTDNSHDIF